MPGLCFFFRFVLYNFQLLYVDSPSEAVGNGPNRQIIMILAVPFYNDPRAEEP